MVDQVIRKMTDEQKQMVIDANLKDIVCVTQRSGNMFCGLVKVMTGKGIGSIVARTGNVFDDDAEALDVAEAVVNEILDSAPEKKSEPVPKSKAKPKPKTAAPKKKSAKKKKKKTDPKKTADETKANVWEFYTDTKGEWRWRHTASNGEIVGAATEGYANRADCEKNARQNGWVDSTSTEG